jgi:hypothetical protein
MDVRVYRAVLLQADAFAKVQADRLDDVRACTRRVE